MKHRDTIYYRLSQVVGWLLGIRIFVLSFFTFALYVSTFFLFLQEDSFHKAVFDAKIHGIIFCSVISIAAGGIINTFYDWEKDRLQRPFRSRLQSFLKQKYFLYSYIFLNVISLGVACFLSFRIFLFFLFYQFIIWFYSHKLSKIVLLNNLTYVSLSLYPFFGILVYYQHFSVKLFWMASFLFVLLLVIDIMKDILTIRIDKFFLYHTLPNTIGVKFTVKLLIILLFLCGMISYQIMDLMQEDSILRYYYSVSILICCTLFFLLFFRKFQEFILQMNFLRFWIFVGVIFMLMNGIFNL